MRFISVLYFRKLNLTNCVYPMLCVKLRRLLNPEQKSCTREKNSQHWQMQRLIYNKHLSVGNVVRNNLGNFAAFILITNLYKYDTNERSRDDNSRPTGLLLNYSVWVGEQLATIALPSASLSLASCNASQQDASCTKRLHKIQGGPNSYQ